MHYMYWWRSIYDCHLFLPINISSVCKNWIVFQVVFHLFVWKSNFHHLSVLYNALIKFLLTEVSGYIMWGHPLFLTKWLTSSQPPCKLYESWDWGCDPFNQNFRKFRSKTEWIGTVQPEKFRKNGSTFWGGPLFPVGPVGILVEWIVPWE